MHIDGAQCYQLLAVILGQVAVDQHYEIAQLRHLLGVNILHCTYTQLSSECLQVSPHKKTSAHHMSLPLWQMYILVRSHLYGGPYHVPGEAAPTTYRVPNIEVSLKLAVQTGRCTFQQ